MKMITNEKIYMYIYTKRMISNIFSSGLKKDRKKKKNYLQLKAHTRLHEEEGKKKIKKK